MVFNKHNEKNNRVVRKDVSEWIIALGNHPGVIPSKCKVENLNGKQNEKKNILKKIVDFITWDGYKLEINIL